MWSLCSHFLILVHQKETVPVFYGVIWAQDILSGLKGKICGKTRVKLKLVANFHFAAMSDPKSAIIFIFEKKDLAFN